MSIAFVHVYVCVAAAATFSALIVPAVESCPSFTSSVEEGRAVCPGEELTYTCTIFQMGGIPIAVWSGFCADSSDIINIAHGILAQESGMCGPFLVQATGSDGGCHTSTLTVTASPELNGTVIQCSNGSVEVGKATLLVAGPPSPIPIPTQNPSTDTLTSTTIEWSVPGDSGANITSYTITYTSESVEGVDGSATSALLTGLRPNVDYEANITASNCAGTSEPTAFSFGILGTTPPAPVLSVTGSKCDGNFPVSWNIPHPPPPPAYEPVEAVWVNYTVEKEDGAFASPTTVVENVILGDDYTYLIENATLGATYTITVSALNQLGWSGSNITVNTCTTTTPTGTTTTPTGPPTTTPPATTPTDTGGPAPFPVVAVLAPVIVILLLLLLITVFVIVFLVLFRRAPKQQKYLDASSVAKRNEEIEMEENTAYGPIGSAGAHPTTTQAPVYEEVASKPQDMFSITHNTAYGQVGQTGTHMTHNTAYEAVGRK